VTDFTNRLGVTRVALSRVLNARAAISAEMAVRLGAVLGGSAESWLTMQANYDLWQARRKLGQQISRIARSAINREIA
jgi:addiction module HigA family antidote